MQMLHGSCSIRTPAATPPGAPCWATEPWKTGDELGNTQISRPPVAGHEPDLLVSEPFGGRSQGRTVCEPEEGDVKIGLMVSRHGPAGLWAFACDSCAMLAAAEINAHAGVLDREVELVLADAGTAGIEAGFAARTLVELDQVDAVIGMHASNMRASIAHAIARRVPYVYAPMYEGGERTCNVLPIGGTDEELLGYAVPALMALRRAQRFFLFGNDYIWPRLGAASAGRVIARHGGRVVGSNLVPFGIEDYSRVLAEIVSTSADVVVTLLLGEETIRFNRAFAAAGLGARILRLGLAVDETVLYGGGEAAHENLYVATTYVATAQVPRGDQLVELYRNGFGSLAPPVTVFGQSCYDSVHLLASLAQAGRRDGRTALRRRFSHLAGRHPGRNALPPALIAAADQVYLAEAQGLELKVVAAR